MNLAIPRSICLLVGLTAALYASPVAAQNGNRAVVVYGTPLVASDFDSLATALVDSGAAGVDVIQAVPQDLTGYSLAVLVFASLLLLSDVREGFARSVRDGHRDTA